MVAQPRNWSAEMVAIRTACIGPPGHEGSPRTTRPWCLPAGPPRAPGPLWLRYSVPLRFDLLHVDDEDLRGLALVERRALLS